MNPNHPAYRASRGQPAVHPPNRKAFQQLAQHKKHCPKEVGDNMNSISKAVCDVFGSSAHLVLSGSHKKKTASGNSDRDYFIQTDQPVTRAQRKNLVQGLQNNSSLQQRYPIIRAKTNAISLKGTKKNVDVDLVPQNVAYTQRRQDFVSKKTLPTESWAAFHNNPAMQQAAVHYPTLPYTTLHYPTLHYPTLPYTTLH